MTTAKTPVAASLVAVLALTACSGGGSLVYDFTEEPVMEPASSIEFRIPDELAELSEDYLEDRVYESITVSAVDSDDPSGCAVEMEFDFADGGLERYLEYQENDIAGSDTTLDERMASRLTGENLDQIELSEDYSSAVVPVECAASPTDDESVSEISFSRFVGDGDQTRSLARVKFSAMQGGELYVHEPEVENWELDSNGNWIRAE
ncbi:hypothetical protein [Nocardiopsis sp. NRRL B-16309]|uniref:hypothetical protein n=1 Tax=Nocardiopsis sp. NRRL B-16309 TaxID=1519494 RepID=UPI0006ADCD15|nr:hypothetical protein [Nocardiopsis sp. NRRL B-16309]KOX14008.1 hypothetical protein ADL05_17345 [Nocardiopsis sp. NRRL B-16309]